MHTAFYACDVGLIFAILVFTTSCICVCIISGYVIFAIISHRISRSILLCRSGWFFRCIRRYFWHDISATMFAGVSRFASSFGTGFVSKEFIVVVPYFFIRIWVSSWALIDLRFDWFSCWLFAMINGFPILARFSNAWWNTGNISVLKMTILEDENGLRTS